jgi:hypothetical protein
MFSLFKKKSSTRNPEIVEYLKKIDQINYAIFNDAMRPQYGRVTVLTRIYKLSECIRKTKHVLSLFHSEQMAPVSHILLDRQNITLSEFVAESFLLPQSLQDQFVELFSLFKKFLIEYEVFSQKPCSTVIEQNKLRFFQVYYLFIKEFTQSVSEIRKK